MFDVNSPATTYVSDGWRMPLISADELVVSRNLTTMRGFG